MKIAYVVDDYTNSGGMERVLARKANYFAEFGYEVYIISPKAEDSVTFFPFHTEIIFRQIQNLPQGNYIDALTDCLSEIKPDIAISMGLGDSRFLYKAKDKSKKILEIHFPKYNRKYWFATWDKYRIGRYISDRYTAEKTEIARGYDAFVVLTEEDRESWRNLDNLSVISNPLSFVPTEYSDNTQKRVIAVGRFAYQKGYEYLIDIWKDVAKLNPDWTLSIFGNGRKRKQIEKLVQKYNLSDSVELNEPTKDIVKEYLKSSIYVLTSRYEGHPLALLEAMSLGLASVSFACKCGPKDIITNEADGYIVDFKDREAFVEKLSLLMNNQSLRQQIGSQACENILRYSEENIMPRWIRLFESVLSRS